ncbi:hypothetical protein SNEBB_011398 [Seison nebaliae]|nr:hypothetical protein SNEBB_011398 [Seison nebaliae]
MREDDKGEYINDGKGNLLRVGRPRYIKDEKNRLIPSEKGNFILDNKNNLINLNDEKRLAIDSDGNYVEDDNGEFVLDNDGNILSIGRPRMVRISDKLTEYSPDDVGDFVRTKNGNLLPLNEKTKRYRLDNESNNLIPDNDGEYVKDDKGNVMNIGRPRYRKDSRTNKFIPDEKGDFIKSDDGNQMIPIQQQQRYKKDTKTNEFIPSTDGNFIKDKNDQFVNVGPKRYKTIDDKKKDDDYFPSQFDDNNNLSVVPSSNGSFIISDHGKLIDTRIGDRYTIDETDGNVKPSSEGEYIKSGDELIRVGKPRYSYNENGQLVKDEKGHFVKNDEGRPVPIDNQRYHQDPTGKFIRADDGEYVSDGHGDYVCIGPKRHDIIDRKQKPTIPSTTGSFIQTKDGDTINLENRPRFRINEQTNKMIPDDNGNFVEDNYGNFVNVGKRRYTTDHKGNFFPDENGEFVRDDDTGRFISVDQPKYVPDSTGKLIPSSKGNYISDGRGNFIDIGPERRTCVEQEGSTTRDRRPDDRYLEDDDGNLIDRKEKERYSLDEKSGKFYENPKGEYVKDKNKNLIRVGRPERYVVNSDGNLIPSEKGNIVETGDGSLIDIDREERYRKDDTGKFVRDKDGKYVSDKKGDFILVGKRRTIPTRSSDDDIGSFVRDSSGCLIPVNEYHRYMKDVDGKFNVDDDKGIYVKDDKGNYINVGKKRFEKNERNEFIPSEHGDYVRNDDGNFIPLREKRYSIDKQNNFIKSKDGNYMRQSGNGGDDSKSEHSVVPKPLLKKRYKKMDDGRIVEAADGNYIMNDDNELIPYLKKRYKRLPNGKFVEDDSGDFIFDEKNQEYIPVGAQRYRDDGRGGLIADDFGRFIRDPHWMDPFIDVQNRQRYSIDENGQFKPSHNGEYILNDRGQPIHVGKKRFDYDKSGHLIPDESGCFVKNEEGEAIPIVEKRYKKKNNEYVEDVKGDYVKGDDGNYTSIHYDSPYDKYGDESLNNRRNSSYMKSRPHHSKLDGDIEVTMEGPTCPSMKSDEDKYGRQRITYTPTSVGDYKINVKHDGQHVKGSPFDAYVSGDLDVSQIKCYGVGLSPDGVFLDSPSEFTVDARAVTSNGQGEVRCEITGPKNTRAACPVKNNRDGTYSVQYVPFEEGQHQLDISYEGMPVPGSPFSVRAVRGCDPARVKAYGPGLYGGITNVPQEFKIETKGAGQGSLGLAVEGPSEAKMQCKDNRDGTCTMEYLPTKSGAYDISIKFAEQHIPGSPFKVQINDMADASKVKVEYPNQILRENVPADFVIDGRNAGTATPNNEASLTPYVELIDPVGRRKPAQIRKNNDGTFSATVLPTAEGPHAVDVQWAGEKLPNSPFPAQVHPSSDARLVKVNGLKPNITASLPTTFNIDSRDAGNEEIKVKVNDNKTNQLLPVDMKRRNDGTFDVSFTAPHVGDYDLDVLYGNENVQTPNKLFANATGDAENVNVYGSGINPQVQIHEEQKITADTSKGGIGKLTCNIRDPTGRPIPLIVDEVGDGNVNIFYTPVMNGPHQIETLFGGRPVKNGDRTVNVIDKYTRPIIEQQPQPVHQISPQTSMSHTSKTSLSGHQSPIRPVLNASITSQNSYQNENEQPYSPSTTATPIHINRSTISPTQQSQIQNIPQQPSIHSISKSPSNWDGKTTSYRPVDLRLPVNAPSTELHATIITPNGEREIPIMEDNTDGTVSVRYQPHMIGIHELQVNHNGVPLPGAPFKFHVEALPKGYVSAHGPGLSSGVSGEPAHFKIITKDAGAGGLSLAVEGPSKAEIDCHDNKDGTCDVTYYPLTPGDYHLSIKFADQHIQGSPFLSKVQPSSGTAYSPKRAYLTVGNASEVSLKLDDDTNVHELDAYIRAPSGKEEPCLLKKLSNGTLGISFTPREVGDHYVSVFKNGKQINGSPFNIHVGPTEIGNANRVRTYGSGLHSGKTNELNEFTVNTKDAGYGGLSLSIEGPSKADIECHDNEDGTCRVTYRPTEPGNYVINVKFADKPVPGSPFHVPVVGEGVDKQREIIKRTATNPEVTHIGSQCELSLKIPGVHSPDLSAYVTAPSGRTEACGIHSLDDNNYSIKFVPQEMGVHKVSVKHRNTHIPGSPFEFTVGPIEGGGAYKVHAHGPGLVRGEVNKFNEFSIYTREAGAGGLSIAVEGPAKAEINFEDRKDGTCGVTYVCGEPGQYQVAIKFNDEHIPDSPYSVYVSPPAGDARRLNVENIKKPVQANKPCTFTVDMNGVVGDLTTSIVSPSGIEERGLIDDMGDGHCRVKFIPHENGVHWVHVRLNGTPIPESPFRVVVGDAISDPGRVSAYGPGLHQCDCGRQTYFIVNTLNAGAGALAITVDGPSKVTLECHETEEGYRVIYTPTAPGDYLITIKFGGVNIASSPFKCHVFGTQQQQQQQVDSLNYANQSMIQTSPNSLQVRPSSPYASKEQSVFVVETVEKQHMQTNTTSSSMGAASQYQQFQQRFNGTDSITPTQQQRKLMDSAHGDAKNVRAFGPGLENAKIGQESSFNVDTTSAGNNMLMVGIYGPTHPCEELHVRHQGNNKYIVSYTVKERGLYVLVVKWGEDHIPGSPFNIEVQ